MAAASPTMQDRILGFFNRLSAMHHRLPLIRYHNVS